MLGIEHVGAAFLGGVWNIDVQLNEGSDEGNLSFWLWSKMFGGI